MLEIVIIMSDFKVNGIVFEVVGKGNKKRLSIRERVDSELLILIVTLFLLVFLFELFKLLSTVFQCLFYFRSNGNFHVMTITLGVTLFIIKRIG